MSSATLKTLIRYLEKDYYVPIAHCCSQIIDIIADIHGGDDDQTASLYTSLSKKLAELVDEYLMLQRQVLKPYENAGASTSSRDEYCIKSIRRLEGHIQLLLMQLHSVVAPLPQHSTHQEWDKSLRQKVEDLNTLLIDMFQLQRKELDPQMQQAGALSNKDAHE